MAPRPHKSRDLAAVFHAPGRGESEAERAHQFTTEYNDENPQKTDSKGKFIKGGKVPGCGRKKGGNNDSIKAIKQFMLELLDDEVYRKGLTRRIKAGELPQIELFLITKVVGKPKEEVEITTNVPLFALPSSFVLKEDTVEAEDVKVLTEGDENGANQIRE